jgi:hypothetical protein
MSAKSPAFFCVVKALTSLPARILGGLTLLSKIRKKADSVSYFHEPTRLIGALKPKFANRDTLMTFT